MSLEDKIINPMAPAQLPGQRSEPLPKAGKKRRKGGAMAGVALGKPKKGDIDDEVGGDTAAVLTLGAGDEARRPQKKMLFESASDGATLSFAGPAIRREAPKAAAVAPAARAPQPAAEPAPTPAAARPAAKAAPIHAAPAPQAPAPVRPSAPTPPVFQVASTVMREPEPAPQPEPAREPEAQAELPRFVEPAPADEKVSEVAAVEMPAPTVEGFDESLTLAFDATLADGLAERMAGEAAEEIPPASVMPAPEPTVVKNAEPPLPAIETFKAELPASVQSTPTPAANAPVAEAAKAEGETPGRLSRSEAIARAARMSARATPRPVPTAAETLAAARTAQQQLRSADLPRNPGDIYGYWTRVKNGRRFPSRSDFDAEQVAEHWPNSMLLTCGNSVGAGSHGNFSSVLRLGANRRTRPGEDLNFTSMITEWILATGGEAARAGTPVQDTEVFPTPDGTHAYKIVALPLSENQTRVDHVLCHLSRS